MKISLSQGLREKVARKRFIRETRVEFRQYLRCRDIWDRVSVGMGSEISGWSNGDKWNLWTVSVATKSSWGYAVDLEAMRHIRWVKRRPRRNFRRRKLKCRNLKSPR